MPTTVEAWHVAAVANGIIAAAYLGICAAILIPLYRTAQLRSNKLGVATASIFFSCAVHHGGHTFHLLAPMLGWHLHSGEAMRASFNWYMASWDVLSVVVALYYWTLRRTYGSLMKGAKLFEDLEERARAADRLAEQRGALLSAVLDSIVDGVVVADADGNVLVLNPAAERYLRGGSADTDVNAALVRARAGETITGAEILVERGDRHIPLLINANPLTGDQGGSVVVLHDITELRRHDEQRRESEEVLRLLLDGARDYSILMLDPTGVVCSWSANAERMHGYSAEEAIGVSYRSLFDADDRAAGVPERLLADARAHGRAEISGLRVRRDGTAFHAQTVVTPVFAGDGALRGFVTVANDITERRRHEQAILDLNNELENRVAERTAQLERQANELRTTNSELEAFSYSVSHDLRAPLRAMNGFAAMIEEEHGHLLPEAGRRQLAKVRSAAQQMGQLIDALLAFSRLQRQAMNVAPLDPADLVRDVWDELAPDREGRDVTLDVGDLPGCDGDVRLLRQVFGNLLGNAVKYTAKVEQARIEVGGRVDGSEVEYWVRDNGAGFDMRYADKLFKVFQRLHRASEFDGTGIGLALVARIVSRHGGRVRAEGSPGEGATFHLVLPRTTTDERAPTPQRELADVAH
ncbi:hypothetical protein Val02_38440 [Virgisporangium aliadipatigenens]|uniref:Sensor-like histidine kinase SenX3 n=1 Tax=Virgisporangium aliadipatigenens TaxID=741659 RepID=A0A8J3YNL1_9ACTN|nr:PAS domain S-box protein [Virgisporangium aliadipatigenens]GIJ46958.1 hypothetical protein Val02_38440 [Virgisporangium aliadipatigenens]